MMQRSVAATDPEPIGGSNRGADIGLGFARGGRERQSYGQPGGDGGRKGAAAAMGVFSRDARRREPQSLAARFDQKIDTFRAAAVAALDQHRTGAEREQLLRL